ncbi:hypothetical protein, partial [Escherichia coli]|uniref:hypothetical protein n=1 Tax=Escherichia coli TaxID=562 RepID=UPI0028DD50BD
RMANDRERQSLRYAIDVTVVMQLQERRRIARAKLGRARKDELLMERTIPLALLYRSHFDWMPSSSDAQIKAQPRVRGSC